MISHSPEETFQFGFNLASQIVSGSVIALSGELGAGKTLLARGICRGLGYKGDVTSPSYVRINTYPHTIPIYHADFYLIESDDEISELGIEELFSSESVVIIEWAQRFPHLLPKSCLWIDIEWCEGEKEMRKIEVRKGR
ncbi:MAG: tRNA (adenosine(37)-N6)-threonylcarbamoyltransferase complex ATPase subunit type 1 TsaE [Calditrichaeota bacterium]|nr:tRNA (adenosine(37)-N6)-threonylcarbamoyltransferase complex ATPase subunit type 1 TsaE [Calditrichota bacterium]